MGSVRSPEFIRNFCIIAHIDHGKSTLADRILLRTRAVSPREFREQMLDDMDLERERGITIKARAVTLNFEHGGENYMLNLIDTPGHVDFQYEVSRSLAACEGALLLVDATQGIEAQTVANAYKAIENDLAIVPVVNKIDLPRAETDKVAAELARFLAVDESEVLRISAKEGIGIEDVMRAIVERIPPPRGSGEKPLKALIFDSVFDDYRGVVVYIRVFEGRIAAGDRIRLMQTGKEFEVVGVGRFTPRRMVPADCLSAGEVGYCFANIREVRDVRIGDTIVMADDESAEPLPGYREPQPMVFCGMYPTDNDDYEALRQALERLRLNDSSFTFQPETSKALGFGFRCGFLGLLHMDVIRERLERESDVEVVQTAPNVSYEVLKRDGSTVRINSPEELPPPHEIKELREPVARVDMIVPVESLGGVFQLAEQRRGKHVRTEYLSPDRVIVVYEIPLAEMLYDFYDKLKSGTRGYGTMDYEFIGFKAADLVKLDIIVAGERVDALSCIVHREAAEKRGRELVKKLRGEIDRHLFEVVIQAAINGRVIARESIAPLAKHVTGKCYGGDITRKRKLLAKQREGKKRLKHVGRVDIPQEAFMAVLQVGKR